MNRFLKHIISQQNAQLPTKTQPKAPQRMRRDQRAMHRLPLEEAAPSSSQVLAYTSSLADLRKFDRAFEVSPPLTFQRVAEKPSFVIPPEIPVPPRAGKKLCTSAACPPLEREQSKDEANKENDQRESQMSVFCVSMASILSEIGDSCATVADYQDDDETVNDNCFDGDMNFDREMFPMANLQPTLSPISPQLSGLFYDGLAKEAVNTATQDCFTVSRNSNLILEAASCAEESDICTDQGLANLQACARADSFRHLVEKISTTKNDQRKKVCFLLLGWASICCQQTHGSLSAIPRRKSVSTRDLEPDILGHSKYVIYANKVHCIAKNFGGTSSSGFISAVRLRLALTHKESLFSSVGLGEHLLQADSRQPLRYTPSKDSSDTRSRTRHIRLARLSINLSVTDRHYQLRDSVYLAALGDQIEGSRRLVAGDPWAWRARGGGANRTRLLWRQVAVDAEDFYF
eukprot:g79890.t1